MSDKSYYPCAVYIMAGKRFRVPTLQEMEKADSEEALVRFYCQIYLDPVFEVLELSFWFRLSLIVNNYSVVTLALTTTEQKCYNSTSTTS